MLTFSYSCIQHYFGKRGGEGEETEKHLTILPTHEEASQSHTKSSRHETAVHRVPQGSRLRGHRPGSPWGSPTSLGSSPFSLLYPKTGVGLPFSVMFSKLLLPPFSNLNQKENWKKQPNPPFLRSSPVLNTLKEHSTLAAFPWLYFISFIMKRNKSTKEYTWQKNINDNNKINTHCGKNT